MVDITVVSDFMVEHFENVNVDRNGTHWVARCPLCGDSKKNPRKRRFNLDYNNGKPIFHCFNCGESGGFVSLYSQVCGIPEEEVLQKIRKKFSFKDVKKRLNGKKKKKVTEKRKIYDDVFYDSIGLEGISYGHMENIYKKKLQDFYNERRVPENIELRICMKGRYSGRILIPIMENGHVVYFQGRSIHENPERKYLNPKADKNIILNRENFDREKYIIVVEGLLDAYVIGNQATTCLGSYISEDFIKEVSKYTDKGIILAFDNDEPGEKSRNKFITENPFNKSVKYFLTPQEYSNADDINNIVRRFDVDPSDLYNIIVDNSYGLHKLKTKKWS